MFITFEGGDGAGKSTVIARVKESLEKVGKQVVLTREPGGVPLGEEIRALLLESKTSVSIMAELLLFLASRAQHVEEKIKPALASGKIVLCDRFTDSTLAYQGYARELGIAALLPICKLASGGLEPNLTLYLDLDPAVGLARAKSGDRMEGEAREFHEKVRKGFLKLAEMYPERIHKIDASKTPDEVYKQVMHYVNAAD